MNRNLLVTVVLIFISYNCAAQHTILTLRECIETGINNNLSLKSNEQDVWKSGIEKSESRARLLPVIQGFGNFNNNVHPGTTVTDGSGIAGLLGIDMPYLPSKGLRYVTSGGFQLSMPLYDQTIYTGISIAKKMEEISGYSYEKAKEDLTVEISNLYYAGQTTAEQIRLTEENIQRLVALRDITQAFHDNGMALNVDIKRVSINLENMRTLLDNLESMYEQQLNLIRYVLDLSPETIFALEPIRRDLSDGSYLFSGLSSDLYELRLLDAQEELILQQKKSINQGYLPTLSLVGQISYSNFTDKFSNYFHSNTSNSANKWYNTTYWGLSLKIPIFDGMAKNNKVRKANIDYQKVQFVKEDTRKKLETQYNNAVNEWNTTRRNVEKQTENYLLAEEVYTVTTERYKEGVVTMSELLQDELRLNEAQVNYTIALYNCMTSELSLLKLSGQLDRLTK